MPTPIADLFERLVEDPWRPLNNFTPEMEAAHHRLFDPDSSDDSVTIVLNDWLQRFQPCLFGRMAAKMDAISYCILRDSDLGSSDDLIMKKVQRSRLAWKQAASRGRKSGFIILVLSSRIAYALPNEDMRQLALRLCSLYLLTEAQSDNIHLDDLFLEGPGQERPIWKWNVGVNYFSAQADKRWWQDHRIPGGFAFSMNSVGHMVKSGIVSNFMNVLDGRLGLTTEDVVNSKVDSLEKALELAMRTIWKASEAVSGKATELLPLSSEDAAVRQLSCPLTLPRDLADKDFCTYKGYYHTDYSVPSEYFVEDVYRPDGTEPYLLDFTYLFHRDVDNYDFLTTGEGLQVRTGDVDREGLDRLQSKISKGLEEQISIDEYEEALRRIADAT